ncbi:MAG: hypothetical protein NTW28_00445 [Candidatus Solibacter sp.]|nr:hypothetical protein [Candidatus Solibacter sp.]
MAALLSLLNSGISTLVMLKTCRLSVSELPRSRRRLVGSLSRKAPESMLFCSGASSMACDQVYVA